MSKGKPSAKKKATVPVKNAEPASISIPPVKTSIIKKEHTILYQKIALFLIAFLVFGNSIPNRYNLDDELYTVNAQKIVKRGWEGVPHIFTHRTFSDNENAFEYRPLAMLSFVLQFMTIGSSAIASHVVNVLLYALTTVLLFSLLLKWFKKAHGWYAFAVCLLFVVHPLHTEVVASAKSRDELLAFFFVVVSFLVAWRYHETGKFYYILLYPLAFVLAIISKKTIIPLVVIPSIAFYFFTDMSLKKIFLFFLPILIVFRGTAFTIATLLPQEQRLFFSMENPFYTGDFGIAIKTATGMYISGWYLYLHFIPFPLVSYYGYKYVPLVGWDNILVWVSSLVYLSLIVYILWNVRKRGSIPVFGAIWFIMGIFIFSNLFRPAPGMMAERFMYSASFGFCILFCWILFRLFKVDPDKFTFDKVGKRLALVMVIICTAYAARSVDRNMDWANKLTLYSHDVKYTSESAKANMLNGELMMGISNVYKQKAITYKDAGEMQNARMFYDSSIYYLNVAKENFKKAIEITPNMGSAINNLAVIYFNLDSPAQARYYINVALQGSGNMKGGDVALNANDRAKLNHNLGVLYYKNGNIDSALQQFQLSIYYDSTFGEAYIDMSEVLLMSRDTADAIKVLKLAAKNMPGQNQAYTDLANIALYRNDTVTAIMYCELAAQMKKVNPQIVLFLKNYYQSKNDAAKAQFYEQKLQELMNDHKQNVSQISN